MLENEIPLFVIHLKIHWVIDWIRSFTLFLLHNEEWWWFSFPFGWVINLFINLCLFRFLILSLFPFLLLRFGLIQIVEVRKLFSSFNNKSCWNKFFGTRKDSVHFKTWWCEWKSTCSRFFSLISIFRLLICRSLCETNILTLNWELLLLTHTHHLMLLKLVWLISHSHLSISTHVHLHTCHSLVTLKLLLLVHLVLIHLKLTLVALKLVCVHHLISLHLLSKLVRVHLLILIVLLLLILLVLILTIIV